jgi:Class III cytochrome C family
VRNIHRSIIIVVVMAFVMAGCYAAFAADKQAPETVTLTGSPMGGVKFPHKQHAVELKIKCDTCHHASKPEKPLTSPQEACTDCHTKTATPPMKTKLQAAFHNPTAQAGLCIDCHKAENAKGKKAPVKCADCHKKENV